MSKEMAIEERHKDSDGNPWDNFNGKGWPAWKPGYFDGPLDNGRFRRVWWGWFAIGWVKMNLYEWNRYVESGKTEWRFK